MRLLLLLGLLAVSTVTAQPVPIGAEFRVNTYTTSNQHYPSVAMNRDGGFVATWASFFQDGGSVGVYAQMYGPDGTPVNGEFRVNTETRSIQNVPEVSMDADGDFVVVWESNLQDGSMFGIYGQRYSAAGTPLGDEFRVNTVTTDNQRDPSVSMNPGGGFVVVWKGGGQDEENWGIYGQRYDSSGSPQGSEFHVNTYIQNTQDSPSVAMDTDGGFVVVWSGEGDGDTRGVFARRFGASGDPTGPDFRVHQASVWSQENPRVSIRPDGSYIVIWDDDEQWNYNIYARLFDVDGSARGTEFRVNSRASGLQILGSVAGTESGYVVAWHGTGTAQQDPDIGIFAQALDALGAPRGGEFHVNTYTAGYQTYAYLSASPDGGFVVAWASEVQDGSQTGIFAQRYRAVTVGNEPGAPSGLSVAVTPNPAGAGGASIRLHLPIAGHVRVSVLDVLGREVAVLLDGETVAGDRSVSLNTSGWSAGVYVVRAEASGRVSTSRLVVAR